MSKRITAGLLAGWMMLAGISEAETNSDGVNTGDTISTGEIRMTISFTGDVTLGCPERGRNNAESFDSYAEREGYDYFFRNVKDLFEKDDLTLVNLEGVLSDRSWGENGKKNFRFRGRTDFAKILTGSGIEACSIANNHIMDYGYQGYNTTVKTLEDNNLKVCGNSLYFVFEKEGAKAAFFSFNSGYLTKAHITEVGNLILGLRRQGVGAILCCFHAGQEYIAKRRKWDQERYAKVALTEWGADLVVMHHPHVLQGIDKTENQYVFYSLGNFCFGGNTIIRSQESNKNIRTLETCVLQMDLVFDEKGRFLGQEGRMYPCYSSSSAATVGDPNDYQPKRVSGAQAAGVIQRLQEDTAFDLGRMNREEGYLPLDWLPGAER